jgi:hypothetical protein
MISVASCYPQIVNLNEDAGFHQAISCVLSADWHSGEITETLIVKLSNVDALQMVERIRLKEIMDILHGK